MRVLAMLLAATALAGCSAAEEEKTPEPVALVKLAPAQAGAVEQSITLYGAVENGPFGRHVLAAPAEGTLVAIDAPAGSPVHAGQVVARLAPSPATRLDMAKAGVDLSAAQAALARAVRLRADGLVSDADVETARAALRTADATRASLAARSGGLALRAPAAGYVETVSFAPGDLVPAGGAVAAISASGRLRARFGLDPVLAARVHPGARIDVVAPDGTTLPATVQSVNPVIDPQTRLASLYVSLPGGHIGVNSTLTAHVGIPGDAGAGITIPYAALLDDAGQPYVFVVAGDVAHRRDIELGAVNGDRVTVAKGLKPGERVVTEGGTALEDEVKVRTQ